MTPAAVVLTEERILDAAEDVLRRFGPAKATVVDVAKALGVSHGSVYRHFPTKVALRDAVARRWLDRLADPLDPARDTDGPAAERLLRWLERLAAIKQGMALNDPELFATFSQLTTEARDVVAVHVGHLAAQLTEIIADGVSRGEFAVTDPPTAGLAVLHATARFHHPLHAAEWADPAIGAQLQEVWRLLVQGLAVRP
ncbi:MULTISPECIES: TetR family transcriptional regulator [unclassified Arthrobacter]|uniref:TetR family transcriptional regulator n=1 Tax=unclassified Arthrobacter TaxID=235627 RepID=UPI001DD0D4D3|nr:TetR family transcriptional regulator [Arthrobacter sp. Bi26]CAH0243459.1 HTH-type transcriptional regulator MtrR [Arthrobacter sp. Bi26]